MQPAEHNHYGLVTEGFESKEAAEQYVRGRDCQMDAETRALTMTTCVWELTAVRLGAALCRTQHFYADQVEADMAAEQAQATGFATRLQSIPMPTDAKRLADLLADYVGKLNVGGLRQ